MSIADRRERDKQKRRDSIVDAAEKLFFAKGFAATTIDEIAEAAELSKGAIYLYFNREVVAAASTGGEKVSALGRALLLFYERYPNHFKAVFYQHEGPLCPSSEIDHGDILINTLIQDREELHAFSLEVIQGGIADGSIRSDVDPIKTTIVLVSMILGLIRIVALEGKPLLERFHLTAQDLIKAAIDLMGRPLTGAQKQKPPNGP